DLQSQARTTIGAGRRVLVMGGSRGAVALNTELPELLAKLVNDFGLHLSVIHQCGGERAQEIQAIYARLAVGIEVRVENFIDDMAAAYQWADLVICRAGAMTVAELAMAGKPAVLVPFPFAIDDHQTANANYLVGKEAALLMPQAEIGQESSVKKIAELLANPERMLAMGQQAASLAQADAARKVADHCMELARD
ncbi:MAG: UDP-N-acetylglucosamine--N-acetylmuramyl-(pentapeptide) pyrophosphoryl-undecaprenol N-acetylglucosamine transferase, partial [Pseudomonadales bacterium]